MFRLKNNHQPLKLTKITIIYHKIADIEENLGLLGLNFRVEVTDSPQK